MKLAITNAAVLTNNAKDDFHKNAAVHIDDEKITYVGALKDAPSFAPERTIDACGNLVMPGFFDLHTHVPMTLLRGYADDLALNEWLFDNIFPAEENLTDEMA